MKARLLPLLALMLAGGCTPAVTTYSPLVDDVQGEWGQLVLTKDENHCLPIALGHKTPWSFRAVGLAAGSGAAQNLTTAAVSLPAAPVVLGAGAAGGAGAEIATELGLRDPTQIRILVKCLDARSRKSGAYSVIDPAGQEGP